MVDDPAALHAAATAARQAEEMPEVIADSIDEDIVDLALSKAHTRLSYPGAPVTVVTVDRLDDNFRPGW